MRALGLEIARGTIFVLRAKVIKESPDESVKGVPVQFWLNGKDIGYEYTSTNGTALLEYELTKEDESYTELRFSADILLKKEIK